MGPLELESWASCAPGGAVRAILVGKSRCLILDVICMCATCKRVVYALKFTTDYRPAPMRTGNLISTPRKS